MNYRYYISIRNIILKERVLRPTLAPGVRKIMAVCMGISHAHRDDLIQGKYSSKTVPK